MNLETTIKMLLDYPESYGNQLGLGNVSDKDIGLIKDALRLVKARVGFDILANEMVNSEAVTSQISKTSAYLSKLQVDVAREQSRNDGRMSSGASIDPEKYSRKKEYLDGLSRKN